MAQDVAACCSMLHSHWRSCQFLSCRNAMAIGANEVATYETRYNFVIGCGSCVSTHATGGKYFEIIGAFLDSVPPKCLACHHRMNITSATKKGCHENVSHR